MKWLRFGVVIYICAFLLVAYVLIPKSTDLWLQVRIQNQDWDSLKEVQLAVSDHSRQVLATAKVSLSTAHENGRSQLTGSEGWYAEVAETILDASNKGLIVSISAPHCQPKEFDVRRRDIGSSYDLPDLQLGGHGHGFHVAAMHHRLYRTLDLDCAPPAAR